MLKRNRSADVLELPPRGAQKPNTIANLVGGKVVSLEQLAAASARLRRAGRKIVLCHGVFDLFHIGHLRHLKSASEFGDILVVSITGDKFVNKGPDRPAFPSELR